MAILSIDEELKFVAFVLIMGLCAIGFTAFIAHQMAVKKCEITAEGMGLKSNFGFLTRCRVEVSGRLVPIGMIRITDKGDVIVSGDGEG